MMKKEMMMCDHDHGHGILDNDDELTNSSRA